MTDWKSYNGGQSYRILDTDEIEVYGLETPRTGGHPRSMELAWIATQLELREASERFNIPTPWLMGIFGVESGRMKVRERPEQDKRRTLYFNPSAKLWEKRTRARPDGEYSGGYFQVLTSTASRQNKKHNIIENGREITIADLMIPRISILIGASYFRDQLDRYDEDPILAQAAYNAGSVKKRPPRTHPWGFSTHNPHRALYYAQWVNDAVAVLDALEIDDG